jgi:hypothetical protein
VARTSITATGVCRQCVADGRPGAGIVFDATRKAWRHSDHLAGLDHAPVVAGDRAPERPMTFTDEGTLEEPELRALWGDR